MACGGRRSDCYLLLGVRVWVGSLTAVWLGGVVGMWGLRSRLYFIYIFISTCRPCTTPLRVGGR